MNPVFVLMIAANISIGAGNNTAYKMPVTGYTKYDLCMEAAKFRTNEEKLVGISYYCMELEIKR
jgi:hypothetical protein